VGSALSKNALQKGGGKRKGAFFGIAGRKRNEPEALLKTQSVPKEKFPKRS